MKQLSVATISKTMQKTSKNDQILRKFRLDLDIEGDLGKLLELTVLKVWLNG